MVNISSCLNEYNTKNIRFFLNYPNIEVEDIRIKNFAEQLNKLIYNDIKIFEEVVTSTFDSEKVIGNINAISEYVEAFNKNNIISIPIEFSQIVGITDISHVCSYNYDFNLMKKIKLEDLFKQDVNYKRIIESYVMEEIYSIIEMYQENIEYDMCELIAESMYICENPVFYFNNKTLVICISSFELTSRVCNLIEFPICFKNIKSILSEYTLKNILEIKT